jgi:hypothetical protein
MKTKKEIDNGYREKFKKLLSQIQPKKLDLGVELLIKQAKKEALSSGISFEEACRRVYEKVENRVENQLELAKSCNIKSD